MFDNLYLKLSQAFLNLKKKATEWSIQFPKTQINSRDILWQLLFITVD